MSCIISPLTYFEADIYFGWWWFPDCLCSLYILSKYL